MNIQPMPRDDFRLALRLMTGGDLSNKADQSIANLMVVAAHLHALCFAEAARRGWCGISDTGKPVVTYPAWPEGVQRPEVILTAKDTAHV